MEGYADLADLPEDARIKVIGEMIERLPPGKVVGVVIDADEGGAKAARYIDKLTARHKVRVIDVIPGPVPESTTIRLAQRGDA